MGFGTVRRVNETLARDNCITLFFVQDFTKLRVWQQAHQFRLEVYRITRAFPPDERYELTRQVRRSAGSIATNIAESSGYRGEADTARYLQMSLGSCCETLDHLIAARDLEYLAIELYSKLDQDLGAIRGGLIRFLARIRARGPNRKPPTPHRLQ